MPLARLEQVAAFVDQNVRSDGSPNFTGLSIGGVALTVTAAELNQWDPSGKVVSAEADLVLTAALHANRIVMANKGDGIAFTLPEAIGSGDLYRIIIGTAIASGALTVTTADTTNADYCGSVLMVDLDAATTAFIAQTVQATGDDVFTMDGDTQGGAHVGLDWVSFLDIATDLWLVAGVSHVPTGSNPATPFSGT